MKLAIWGWYPPMYEKYKNGKYRIFFNPVLFEETMTRKDEETGQETKEVITRYNVWYEEKELPELTSAIKDKNNLLINQILLKERIIAYDSSSAVNSFFILGIEVWLDKDTRAGLKLRFEAELAMGNTNTTLWYNGMLFPLELNLAIQMLYAIEVYASQCYDCTQLHLSNVNIITNVNELQDYDYTTNYPSKLEF